VILVVGGTGMLGRELVTRFQTSGHSVRVLTRQADSATDLRARGVDIVIGDLRDADAVTAAVAGCDAVVSAAHGLLGGHRGGPTAIDDRGNALLLDVSARAGVGRFVLVSILGARADHPLELFRAKHAAEQHARTSDVPWTVLRPAAYLDLWRAVVGAKISGGGPALVFGRGENRINFVPVGDVATLVERSLTDPALTREVIDVPGPENLTFLELARRLGATKVKHIPRGALRFMSAAAVPVAPGFARRAATAVYMDTAPMTAEPSALHERFPELRPAGRTAT
jgi:uncharacterized protein YbjT (DUF2867 family)